MYKKLVYENKKQYIVRIQILRLAQNIEEYKKNKNRISKKYWKINIAKLEKRNKIIINNFVATPIRLLIRTFIK